MKTKVFETIKKFNMLDNCEFLVIGVSGGIDSMSLLHFLVNNTDKKIISVHINHMLRNSESDRDEHFVQKICELYKIEFVSKKVNVREFSEENKTGIEESARILRYKFFDEITKKNNAKIATAHTLSDNIETIIFNFTRGTGLSGLCGIPPIRGNIIRPFINVSRNEIEEYAKKNSIEFVNDSSNFSDDYSRNRIRHYVIPELKKINVSFEKNAGNCISNLIDENKFVSKISEIKLKEAEKNCYIVNFFEEAIKNRVLQLILKKFKFNVQRRHVNLAKMLVEKKINSFDIDENRVMKIKNEKIVCESRQKKQLTNNQKEFIVLILVGDARSYKEKHDIIFEVKENSSYSDFEFRNRAPGDKFFLKNRNCMKSLKKLFNESKIPVETRSNLKLLYDRANKEIVWIESLGVSGKYIASGKSRRIGVILEKNKM